MLTLLLFLQEQNLKRDTACIHTHYMHVHRKLPRLVTT